MSQSTVYYHSLIQNIFLDNIDNNIKVVQQKFNLSIVAMCLWSILKEDKIQLLDYLGMKKSGNKNIFI